MTKSKKTSKPRQNFDFRMKQKITTLFPTCFRSLLCIRFVAVAFGSEEDDPWRRGPPVTYFGPVLDPPLGGSARKTTTLVRDLEYFIHTKFHQNPSRSSGEEVENVNCLTDDGRTDWRTDGQTDGRRTTRDHNRSLKHLSPVPKNLSCRLAIKIGRQSFCRKKNTKTVFNKSVFNYFISVKILYTPTVYITQKTSAKRNC